MGEGEYLILLSDVEVTVDENYRPTILLAAPNPTDPKGVYVGSELGRVNALEPMLF